VGHGLHSPSLFFLALTLSQTPSNLSLYLTLLVFFSPLSLLALLRKRFRSPASTRSLDGACLVLPFSAPPFLSGVVLSHRRLFSVRVREPFAAYIEPIGKPAATTRRTDAPPLGFPIPFSPFSLYSLCASFTFAICRPSRGDLDFFPFSFGVHLSVGERPSRSGLFWFFHAAQHEARVALLDISHLESKWFENYLIFAIYRPLRCHARVFCFCCGLLFSFFRSRSLRFDNFLALSPSISFPACTGS